MNTKFFTREQLVNLLDESYASAQKRAEVYLNKRLSPSKPMALFGAGNMGQEVARRLKAKGVDVACFIDDTPEKEGTFIQQMPVFSKKEAFAKYGSNMSVVVTILNPKHSYPATEREFKEQFNIDTISIFGLAWSDESLFDCLHGTIPPQKTLQFKDRILQAYDILSDEKSQEEFVRQIQFRLTLDFAILSPKEQNAYFPADVPLALDTPFHFVDAGAYDGDSIESLCQHVDVENIKSIQAFEPDPQNFSKLEKVVLQQGLEDKTKLFKAALDGEEGTLKFKASGDMSASFNDEGNIEVPVYTLIPCFESFDGPAYIKFDIEGAENSTIKSSLKKIKEHKPAMAISIYHKSADIWDIPIMLNDLGVGYKFYLRNHGVDTTDVICYAI